MCLLSMKPPSIKLLLVQVTAAGISLEQEIENEKWVAAQLIADEMKSKLQQLEHQLWFKEKMKRANTLEDEPDKRAGRDC